MARRILVPVDFSDFSRAALDWAIQLARPLDAAIDVLHICPAPAFSTEKMRVKLGEGRDPMALEYLSRVDAEERMDIFLEKMKTPPGFVLGVKIELGEVLGKILQEAADHDLIVMGTHGRTGLSHFVLGSVAEKVVRHSMIPVFTVRGPRPPQVRRILAPIDFSASSQQALEFASELAERFDASIDAVHVVSFVPVERADLLTVPLAGGVNTPFKDWARGEGREQMDQFLEKAKLKRAVQSSVILGEPVEMILELARSERYDLVTLGTHGRTGLERLLLGSVAEKIVRRCAAPVVTVRAG